jgi:crotonobetaine/carnitine-CoA ligase
VKSIPALLAARAADDPDRLLVSEVGGRSATYGVFQSEVFRWAGAFASLGVGAGDTVVTMTEPTIASMAAWLGLSWLRAIDTACNTQFRGRMLAYVINDSGARTILVTADLVERLVEIEADIPGVQCVVVVDGDEVGDLGVGFDVVPAATLLDGAVPVADLDPPEVWDTSAIIYTSGTTGPSKGVLLPWGLQWQNAVALVPPEDVVANDCFYSPFPMYHGLGRSCLVAMVAAGGRFVLRRQFSASEYWDDIRAFGCTTTCLLGPLPTFLWGQPPTARDIDNPLRRAVMLPVIPAFREFAERFGIALRTCFGMTEVGTPFATGWDLTDPRSCGACRDGFEVRLVDGHDMEVAEGDVGELIVRHDEPWSLCQGYLGMPERTADAWRNGWFHTGDAFRRDGGGNYFFVDRIKDSIRRRGENISSFEIEVLVGAHPEVLQAAAVAVPSEVGEDEVKVCIVPVSGVTINPSALIRDLVASMPGFMVPRYVEIMDALPVTDATLRVRKVELRERGVTDLTWDREAAGIQVPR